MAANEKNFKELLGDLLKGKVNFGSTKNDKVFISVDNHFEHNGKIYLVEIDSANEAKLLVGQYLLINTLFKEATKKEFAEKDENDFVFLVVHYYKDYNIERTIKNLKLVKDNLALKIGYKVLSKDDFKDKSSFLNLL